MSSVEGPKNVGTLEHLRHVSPEARIQAIEYILAAGGAINVIYGIEERLKENLPREQKASNRENRDLNEQLALGHLRRAATILEAYPVTIYTWENLCSLVGAQVRIVTLSERWEKMEERPYPFAAIAAQLLRMQNEAQKEVGEKREEEAKKLFPMRIVSRIRRALNVLCE